MSMCNPDSRIWSIEELKQYGNELWYNVEFEDKGYAFVETLDIYAAIQEDPVYTEEFFHDGDLEKFLETLGDIFV